MAVSTSICAWQPPVAGIGEVFHARFGAHSYPLHTHRRWTLLLIDTGAVRYDLDRHEHQAVTSSVTVLPPDVPHDGTSARPQGFCKRVIYLEPELLDTRLTGASVDQPELADPLLRHRLSSLHDALLSRDHLEAESRLTLLVEQLVARLRGSDPAPGLRRDAHLARRLRDVLDADFPAGRSLHELSSLLQAEPSQLVRAFGREYGLPPHRYLIGRRLELARRLLLSGRPPAQAATEAGFYDQAHLTRHLRRLIDTTPGRYASSARR